jgi:hypothetical protein
LYIGLSATAMDVGDSHWRIQSRRHRHLGERGPKVVQMSAPSWNPPKSFDRGYSNHAGAAFVAMYGILTIYCHISILSP